MVNIDIGSGCFLEGFYSLLMVGVELTELIYSNANVYKCVYSIKPYLIKFY